MCSALCMVLEHGTGRVTPKVFKGSDEDCQFSNLSDKNNSFWFFIIKQQTECHKKHYGFYISMSNC